MKLAKSSLSCPVQNSELIKNFDLAIQQIFNNKNIWLPSYLLTTSSLIDIELMFVTTSPFAKIRTVQQLQKTSFVKVLNSFNTQLNSSSVSLLCIGDLPKLLEGLNSYLMVRNGIFEDQELYKSYKTLVNTRQTNISQSGINLSRTSQISQSPFWKDILEQDNHTALTVTLLREGKLDCWVDKFLDFKILSNPIIKAKIKKTATNLFPKYESWVKTGLKEEETEKYFVNALLYGDFTKSLDDKTLYHKQKPPQAKVIKLPGTSFGKGVVCFSFDEIEQIRLSDISDQVKLVYDLILAKTNLKGSTFTLTNLKEFVLKGLVTIKEFLNFSKSYGLSLCKLSTSNPCDWQYAILGHNQEIKNDNDKWVGTFVDFEESFSDLLKNTEQKGQEELIAMSIELLHYLAGVVKSQSNSDCKTDQPIEFSEQRLFLIGMDFVIEECSSGKKYLKAIEWAGRIPASSYVRLESMTKEYNQRQPITKALSPAKISLNVSASPLLEDQFETAVTELIDYLKQSQKTLDNQSVNYLTDNLSILKIGVDELGNLAIGYILYNNLVLQQSQVEDILEKFRWKI